MIEQIIKKMLRKWLKKRIIEKTGAFSPYVEKYFNWIYNAPVCEWKDRLWCLCFAKETDALDKVLHLLHE